MRCVSTPEFGSKYMNNPPLDRPKPIACRTLAPAATDEEAKSASNQDVSEESLFAVPSSTAQAGSSSLFPSKFHKSTPKLFFDRSPRARGHDNALSSNVRKQSLGNLSAIKSKTSFMNTPLFAADQRSFKYAGKENIQPHMSSKKEVPFSAISEKHKNDDLLLSTSHLSSKSNDSAVKSIFWDDDYKTATETLGDFFFVQLVILFRFLLPTLACLFCVMIYRLSCIMLLIDYFRNYK